MVELQREGVEKEAGQRRIAASAVEGIADHRCSDRGQMGPYLMQHPGDDPDFDQGVIRAAAQDPEHGFGPAGADSTSQGWFHARPSPGGA